MLVAMLVLVLVEVLVVSVPPRLLRLVAVFRGSTPAASDSVIERGREGRPLCFGRMEL